MSYARLEAEGGLQWPCYDETHPGELFLHSRLWEDPVPGNRVPFVPVDHDPPVDRLDADFPIRLTTGRRLDSYNTGVQTGGYTSPLRRGESLDISPEDAEAYGLADGERVRVVSRRGQVEVPVRIDESFRPGLTFMTLHFQDDVATNLLTIDATDPKSGTAEFKATAIRIEKLPWPAPVGPASGSPAPRGARSARRQAGRRVRQVRPHPNRDRSSQTEPRYGTVERLRGCVWDDAPICPTIADSSRRSWRTGRQLGHSSATVVP